MKRTDRAGGELGVRNITESETVFCQGGCGHVLTDRRSIERGFGDGCWATRKRRLGDDTTTHVHGLPVPAPFRFSVIGDVLLVSEKARGVTIMNRAADVLARINRTVKPLPPLVFFTDRRGATVRVFHDVGKLTGIEPAPAGVKEGAV